MKAHERSKRFISGLGGKNPPILINVVTVNTEKNLRKSKTPFSIGIYSDQLTTVFRVFH